MFKNFQSFYFTVFGKCFATSTAVGDTYFHDISLNFCKTIGGTKKNYLIPFLCVVSTIDDAHDFFLVWGAILLKQIQI